MFSLTDEIQRSIDIANGRRRNRILSKEDVEIFFDTLNEVAETAHAVRRYSDDGFVPFSYKYSARISYIEANKVNGEWHIRARTCDAKRSYGSGPLTTINGKAA